MLAGDWLSWRTAAEQETVSQRSKLMGMRMVIEGVEIEELKS